MIDTQELLDAAARHPLPPGHVCSADPGRFDADLVHHWLSTDAYWALGRSREAQAQMLAGSLVYGVYEEESGAQVGCARIVTDLGAFAYLCDVYIAPGARGRGSAPRSWPPSSPTWSGGHRTACAASCSPPRTPTGSTPSWASPRCRAPSSGWSSAAPDPAPGGRPRDGPEAQLPRDDALLTEGAIAPTIAACTFG